MSIQSVMEQIQKGGPFSERSVTAEQVLGLLSEAVWAPNHHLREPWRFIWVAKDCRSKLEATLDPARHARLLKLLREASACLIVAVPMRQDAREAKDDFAAACCLIQNLQILASASELGMSWHLPLGTEYETFCRAVGLQPDERIAGVVGFGYVEDDSSHEADQPLLKIDIR